VVNVSQLREIDGKLAAGVEPELGLSGAGLGYRGQFAVKPPCGACRECGIAADCRWRAHDAPTIDLDAFLFRWADLDASALPALAGQSPPPAPLCVFGRIRMLLELALHPSKSRTR